VLELDAVDGHEGCSCGRMQQGYEPGVSRRETPAELSH
jgi:hypothetical protein